MQQELKIILNLIRKAVDPFFSLSIEDNIDWKALVDYTLKQGVAGITFDVYHQIKNEIESNNSQNELAIMAWFGYTNIYEKKYVRHKRVIEKLACFYLHNSIKMMLLKGVGMSLYWPVPEHRPSGDIDIYLFGEWKQADNLISEKFGLHVNEGHEHHTCFCLEGEDVENHYDFINTKSSYSAIWIEKKLKELASKATKKLQLSDDVVVLLPPSDFDAIFLIRHLGQHFAGEEVTLRQILDWGFFMRSENKNVNWNEIYPFLKKMDIFEFFCIINSICVNYLGFRECEFPAVSKNESLVNRVMEDVLNPEFEGDVPHNNKFNAIAFKTRRFFANSWKRKLVYKEGLLSQFWHGSIAHLRHWDSIGD